MAKRLAQKLLRDLQENIYCRLQPSRVSGIGVFAIRNIPKGKDPFKTALSYQFVGVPADAVFRNPKIDPAVKALVRDLYVTRQGKVFLYGGGLNSVDLSFFLNHSRKPNVKAAKHGEAFVTMRAIKKGEELFSDYETYSDDVIAEAKPMRNNKK